MKRMADKPVPGLMVEAYNHVHNPSTIILPVHFAAEVLVKRMADEPVPGLMVAFACRGFNVPAEVPEPCKSILQVGVVLALCWLCWLCTFTYIARACVEAVMCPWKCLSPARGCGLSLVCCVGCAHSHILRVHALRL